MQTIDLKKIKPRRNEEHEGETERKRDGEKRGNPLSHCRSFALSLPRSFSSCSSFLRGAFSFLASSPNQRATLLLLLLGITVLAACSGAKPSPQAAPSPVAPNWFKVDPSTAGAVTGKVLFAGKKMPPKKVDMNEDPACAKLHQRAVLDEVIAAQSNGALANAFVYIKQGLEGKQFEPSADSVVIDQQGCWFGPRVLGIQVGQTLKVTNSDPLTHNIHPMPQLNRDWNQSQAPGAEAFTRKFTQPEVMIRVKCNIHSWMHAWIGAVAHPYFAVTGADGAFALRNVPPGTYTLEVWQETLGKQEQQITLAPAGKSNLEFKFKGE